MNDSDSNRRGRAEERRTGPGPVESAAGATDRLSLDAEQRERTKTRLRRIEGQVRGLQRMIDEGRYCGDVLAQIAAVQSSLRGVGEVLLQSHLRHCLADAIRDGDSARAERIYDELTGLFRRYAR